jgi:sulfonate transport system substrate-binding protein
MGHPKPLVAAEEGQTLDGATAIVTGAGYGSPYSFTVASRAALADPAKAAAICDYLSLIAQAHRWANSHLPAWAAVWAKASGLPLSVMTEAASDDYSLAVPITPAVVGRGGGRRVQRDAGRAAVRS